MVYIALCALILGIIFGQFVLDSTWHDLCSELADYVLYLLMFSVGISVGINESIIEKIKNYNLTINKFYNKISFNIVYFMNYIKIVYRW
ncbi:LysO family transporter [uncultured Clostridium sp.]|uniref:LysO family transporter n=1 Tax=uncultured Clostridium sp. TaxID=59620 RepID=UPI00349FFA74